MSNIPPSADITDILPLLSASNEVNASDVQLSAISLNGLILVFSNSSYFDCNNPIFSIS